MSDFNSIQNAFLQSSLQEGVSTAVKAEDVQQNSGIDFSKHYFEAKTGSSYLIKFLPNPGGELITHRSAYKDLPDPERKGKSFHYVSSGNAKTCKALELFFDLHAMKKEGDAIAEKKIEKYMGRTNQGCCKIQVLQSPVAEEIGMVRMMTFATFGPNATIANMLDQKLNPTKEMIANGEEKEDIFNMFDSPVMSLVCTEANYPGKNGAPDIKGRDFTKSSWLKKNRGAIVKMEDGKVHQFTSDNLVNGQVKPEFQEAFKQFVALVMCDDYSVYKYFAYKEVDDARNDKDTNDYLKSVQKKVDEIIPIIRNGSLTEIANYGKKDTSASADGKQKKSDTFADSIPADLAGSVMNADASKAKATDESPMSSAVDAILNEK